MKSGNPLTLSLTIPASAAAVGTALAAARQFAETARLAPDPARRLAIVVEELVANLVDHAGLGAGEEIELALAQADAVVTLSVSDPGAPFDPRQVAWPADLPPKDGGGAGLALVRAFAEIIDYHRVAGRNRLEVRLTD